MYGRYSVEILDKVIEVEYVFETTQSGTVNDMSEAVSFNFDLQMYMSLTEEERVNQYHLIELASKDLFRGIALLGQDILPQKLFPDKHLKSMLCEVQAMIKKMYPDHQLAADHISHYWDMKLATFAVNREMHALVVSFPVFVKDYQKLIKPAPEHTYAMVDRDLLYGCQLDLEHTGVLRQLSICSGNKSAHLTLPFVVNMGFYQL